MRICDVHPRIKVVVIDYWRARAPPTSKFAITLRTAMTKLYYTARDYGAF